MELSVLVVSAALVLDLTAASAQTAAPSAGASDPGNMTRFSRAIRERYNNIKRDIVEAAEAMPEGEYSFKPTPQVRSFGEIVGHIVDAQSFFCGVAGGGNPQYSDAIEKSKTTKAELLKALKDSTAACDAVYSATTSANVLGLERAGQGDALRGMFLMDNVSHDSEHYGNIVTYMRLKGRVPPSTARARKAEP